MFFDSTRKLDEENTFIQKKINLKENPAIDFYDNKRRGIIAFISNLEEDPQFIYYQYKERYYIEDCFRILKDRLGFESFGHKSIAQMEAVAFTNHVSLLYYHGLLRALRNTGLNAKYTPREIMRIANNIRKINQPYAPGPTKEFITESVKGDREILEALGVHLYV